MGKGNANADANNAVAHGLFSADATKSLSWVSVVLLSQAKVQPCNRSFGSRAFV
jgi:hypothetical protein